MQVTDEMVRVALRSYNEDCNGCTAQAPALRRALTAALAAMWQPIETAPKDDRDILVGAWLPEYGGSDEWGQVISSREDRGFRRGYRHRNGANWATHWSPIPPAPSQLSKRGDAEKTAEG